MSKHTPGPWLVGDERHRDPSCIVIHTPAGESVASAWNLLRPDGSGPSTPMETNARLISAAPDLLAALKALADADRLPECNPQYPLFDELDECPAGDEYECGGCRLRRQALAAIAKAEREAPCVRSS